MQNTNAQLLQHNAILEESLKELKHYNKTISTERDDLLTVAQKLPKCSCKCGSARPTTLTRAQSKTRLKIPHDLRASTTSARVQPSTSSDLGAWTASVWGQPSTSSDLGASTTSTRVQPKPPCDPRAPKEHLLVSRHF